MGSWKVIVVLLTQVISLAQSKQMTCDIWFDENLDGLVADCNQRGFTSVPQDLPKNSVGLNLDGNNMKGNLTNGVFAPYPSLIFLILSFNRFEHLETDAFLGLHHLSKLDMSYTTFLDNDSYPQAIFDPLKNLKALQLEGTTRDEFVFPCYIFLPLTKLTKLIIWTTHWPNLEECKELKHLKKLKSLNLITYAIPSYLKNDTFNVLEFLPIRKLTIGGILNLTEDCVFCPLKYLTYIKIAENMFRDSTLHDKTRFMYGLVNRNYTINVIDLAEVQQKHSNVILDRQVIGYLPEICVKRLDLSGNKLLAVRSDTFRKSDIFSKCVEYLDLSRNYILIDIIFYLKMHFMINLTLLDLSQNGKRFGNRFSTRDNISSTGCPQCEDRKKLNVDVVSGYNISLPPKLEYLNLSKTFNYKFAVFVNFTYSNGNNLRVLDLSNNGELTIIGHVRGWSSISHLDISGTILHENTFTNSDLFTDVEILIARKSSIYPTSWMSKDSIFYKVMTNLTQLDLSENSFRVINERTFSRLVNVVALSLSGNQLSYIPEEVLSMPSLTSLDLSFNSINIIKKEERKLLDKKLEQQERFYLDIFGNSISCTCSTLDFVKWLHETRITLGNNGNYSCLTDSGTMLFTTEIYNDLMLYWRRCVGQFWLTVAVSLQLFMIICLLCAFLLKKYFPKVEHEILRWLGRLELKRWDYEYDAYICYGDKDYRWPCHSLYQKLIERDKTLELYVPDLHDPFGEVKAEVIHVALKKSWKLIIVVTEDLFTDEWSNFKVLEALRLFSKEGVITNRILLLYQGISPEAKDRVPNVVLNVVPKKDILQVNPRDDFWTELHQMIISEDLDINVLF